LRLDVTARFGGPFLWVTTAVSIEPHCRIGRVRIKGGADLRIFDARAKRSANVWRQLRTAVVQMHDIYADDLAGFVLMPWDSGTQYNTYVIIEHGMTRNNLPEFAAEALRRDNAESDVRMLLKGEL